MRRNGARTDAPQFELDIMSDLTNPLPLSD